MDLYPLTSSLYSPTFLLTKQLTSSYLRFTTRTKQRLHLGNTLKSSYMTSELYQQIDIVAMSPILVNIIIFMIAFEDAIVKHLLHNKIIKFYVTYVEDTLHCSSG